MSDIKEFSSRKQYLVKVDLQTRYAFMFVSSIGIGVIIGIILTLIAPFLENATPAFPLIFSLIVIFCVMFVALISIFFTHKIAGPIYKFEKVFREIIDEKDLNLRINLRTGDELQELAEEANKLLDSFRHSWIIEQQKIQSLTTQLEGLKTHLPQEAQKELEGQIKSVQEVLEKLGSYYKI